MLLEKSTSDANKTMHCRSVGTKFRTGKKSMTDIEALSTCSSTLLVFFFLFIVSFLLLIIFFFDKHESRVKCSTRCLEHSPIKMLGSGRDMYT